MNVCTEYVSILVLSTRLRLGLPCGLFPSSFPFNNLYALVEMGKNTSTVIPANRKRQWKGNPVVSDDTVMYDYGPSATLTTDSLHYQLQIRPFLREGAPRRREDNCPAKEGKK
jgi:hypothetical protein